MSVIDDNVKEKFSHYIDVLLNDGMETYEELCEREPHHFCFLERFIQTFTWGQNGSEFFRSVFSASKLK